MLKDAPIILLDEATASLDAENESKIQSALSELIKNKTVLIIAHRMRTVSGADKIVVIKDGRHCGDGHTFRIKRETRDILIDVKDAISMTLILFCG